MCFVLQLYLTLTNTVFPKKYVLDLHVGGCHSIVKRIPVNIFNIAVSCKVHTNLNAQNFTC